MATEEKEAVKKPEFPVPAGMLKFTDGIGGVAVDRDGLEEVAVFKDGKLWKKLVFVSEDITGEWRWGVDAELYFQDELAPGEFWSRSDRRSSGDECSTEHGRDYVRVEQVEVTVKVWKEVKMNTEAASKVLAEQLEQQRMERERDEMAYREGFIRGFFGIAPDLNNSGMDAWQDTDAFLDGLVDGRRGQRR